MNAEGKRIKNKLSNHTQFKIDYYKKYLYDLMAEKSKATHDTMTYYLDEFAKVPQSLAEYAKLIEIHQEAENK